MGGGGGAGRRFVERASGRCKAVDFNLSLGPTGQLRLGPQVAFTPMLQRIPTSPWDKSRVLFLRDGLVTALHNDRRQAPDWHACRCKRKQ